MSHQSFRICCPLVSTPVPAVQWVEVASFFRIPELKIIGLAGPEVAEAKERVRAAIEVSGLSFPKRKVVVNLAPSDIKKRGTGTDLAIAMAILLDPYTCEDPTSYSNPPAIACVWGSLRLDGTILSVHQPLRLALAAIEAQADIVLCTPEDVRSIEEVEAQFPNFFSNQRRPHFHSAQSLKDAFLLLRQYKNDPAPPRSPDTSTAPPPPIIPLLGSNLCPSPSLIRATLIASSGAHSTLLLGPRGVGKSQTLDLIARLAPEPSLSQKLNLRLSIESSQTPIHSSLTAPHIRTVGPHIKPSALLGTYSESHYRPGEMALAHEGVLIADEILEWHQDSRECLREPLERGSYALNRSRGTWTIPSRFQFLAAANFCKCGGVPSAFSSCESAPPCTCSKGEAQKYLSRLSGPLLDRFDLVLTYKEGLDSKRRTPNADWENTLLKKLTKARTQLLNQFCSLPGQLSGEFLESWLSKQKEVKRELESLSFTSLRSRHKALRVALTLAALDDQTTPNRTHLFEASLLRAESLWDSISPTPPWAVKKTG